MRTIAQRILVWGNSCSGKSTLAEQLALSRDLKRIEPAALTWLPADHAPKRIVSGTSASDTKASGAERQSLICSAYAELERSQ